MLLGHRWTPLLVVQLYFGLVLLGGATWASSTKDWPQFRGPLQNGISAGNGVLDRARLGLEIAWKRPLGSGYSSISIAGERGVTMFTDGESDFLTAFDVATGEELWRYRIAEMYAGHSGSDDGPISTPTVEDGTVYGLGPRGQLFAVRLEDGREIWSRTLGEEDATTPHYGFATVPIVVGDLLVVQTGGAGGHSITAYDRKSGAPRWSREDDPVNYQSPAVLELGGRSQIVAINDKYLLGLDPKSGEVLWKVEHGTDAFEAFAQPVALGSDRVLVNSLREVAAFQVSKNGSYRAEELWRSNALQRSYAIPVLHEGYLYGFNNRFLTAIQADTGEVAWKSRPPGGRGLILVDGQLLIVSPKGEVVMATAAPGGYAEKARLPVFAQGGMTAPSFAGGHIFVRNLEEMAAIRVTDTPHVTKKADRGLLGEFGNFVRRAEASSEREALVERYFAKVESLPIIEKSGLVHFIYRGEVEDIAIVSNFLPFREEVALDRITGTDVHFKSFELDPEAVYEYRFSVDFGTPATDPQNPLTVGSFMGRMSELRMPKFDAPDFLEEPQGPRGRVDSFQFRSEIRDNERRVRVYVPAGYARSEERYPLILVPIGDPPIESGHLDLVFDNLIGQKRMAPVLVAFVSRVRGEFESESSPDYVRMLTEELVPHLDRHYRTSTDPESRGIMGPTNAGTMAVYTALKAPEHFGKVAAQSLFLRQPFSEELLGLIAKGDPKSWRSYIDWRRHDLVVGEVIDAAAGSKEVLAALEARGFEVEGREVAGSWGWSSWRAELDQILPAFYPAPKED